MNVKNQAFILAALCSFFTLVNCLRAQGTAFTYQGQLVSGGLPANGSYNLTFSLFNGSATNSGQVGATITNAAVGVTNGIFTVTLDFGSGVFTGNPIWLAIEVGTNSGNGFTPLSPLQLLTPTPYSVYSEGAGSASYASSSSTASTAYAVGPGSVTGLGISSGSVVKSLNGLQDAVTLSAGANVTITPSSNTLVIASAGAAPSWSLTGNAGTTPGVDFLGTTDYQPLKLYVDGAPVMQFEPDPQRNNQPNVIGGSYVNFASSGVWGATIAGGGSPYDTSIASGETNSVTANFGTVGGGDGNTASYYSTVAGGSDNTANGPYYGHATVGGGFDNTAGDDFTTVGGGYANVARYDYSTVGGGYLNTASGTNSTVGGGFDNEASGTTYFSATVNGGYQNTASGDYSTVSGGNGNVASGLYAMVPGGFSDHASGAYSLAAGNQAQALFQGDFVWADSQAGIFESTGNDQFAIRAQGGLQLDPTTSLYCGTQTRQMLNLYATAYGIGVQTNDEYFRSSGEFWWYNGGSHNDNFGNPGGGTAVMRLGTTGNLIIAGAFTADGGVNLSSDRNLKENFTPIDSRQILDKVAALPISSWDYKADPASRHVGPMAQDFKASFQLGSDDKHIGVVDEGGVALAAIQGLNEKLEEKDAEIQKLKQSVDELKAMVSQLAQAKSK
ncbi:MAG TPA: tail fiber domain-containing protein [Candidatus Baltobacteraceae bacterium]|jgi:hypothetical protein|nr:tail fiber domain-containing protein [Candidatus Baltobacteraceae bacterium]